MSENHPASGTERSVGSRRQFLAGATASVLGAAVATGATESADAAPTGNHQRPRHVILIDWDGFDPRYLEWFGLPHLRRLIRGGSYGIAAGTYKSISNPSRASMVTGAYPDTHGNFAYAYVPETGKVQGQSRHLEAETITQALAAEGKRTASVGWYMVQNYGNTYGDLDHPYIQPPHPFIHRTETVIDLLNGRPVDSDGQLITLPDIPSFLAVYGNDPDKLGHAEGPHSPDMKPTMVSLDRQLGRIIRETQRVGIYDDTAFIVTSDHAMTAWSKTVLPQTIQTIKDLGFTPERLGSNSAPSEGTDVVLVAFIHTLNVHLIGEANTEQNRRKLADALRQLAGIEAVLEPDDLKTLRAHPVEQLVVESKPPYAFATGEDLPEGEERGSHSSHTEMRLPLIISGKGVRSGSRMKSPRIVDIAPTIAALLGTRPPAQADGRALTEILH